MTVSFDFDETLSRPDVQEYAKELIAKGINVWVITARHDDNHIHRYEEKHWSNLDLWPVIDELGIPRWKVRFMCNEPKFIYLENTNIIWHLDDNPNELLWINNSEATTIGIQVLSSDWKQQCNRILNKL